MPIDAADERHHARPAAAPSRARATRVGAERHAHADLARALRDRVREHAVQPDRREQRRQQRERRRQRADHAIEEHVLLAPAAASSSRSSTGRFGSSSRIDRRESRAAICVGSPRGADVEGQRAEPSILPVRQEEDAAASACFTSLYFASFTRPMISMLSESLRAVPCACRRRRAEVELLRERLVHDRDLRRAERVGTRELAAGEQRHAERLEIARADLVEARVGVGVGTLLEALTATSLPQLLPASSGTMRRRHAGHAGIAASSSSTRSKNCARRASCRSRSAPARCRTSPCCRS